MINLDKLKKMGNELVDSVKSGEMLNKVKSSVDSLTQSSNAKVVLPSDINEKMLEIENQLKALQEAQFNQQKAAESLCRSVEALSKDVVNLFANQSTQKECCDKEADGSSPATPEAECCPHDKKVE